jgi:hypothetical protein
MGVSSPVGFLDVILDDIGMDKDELRYDVQTFNTASKKKTPPQVSLFFSPVDPEEGEKITVTASPSYFLNDPKELYYTWFLKTKNCTDSRDSNYTYKKECDLNSDGRVNIEDHKIKATRIIVNGGFNSANPAIYNSESDDDGYKAYSGGNDQKNKEAYCYVHDTKSGEEYSIDCGSGQEKHLFPNAPGETTGNDRFRKNEEEFWKTDPNSNDTANLGHPDEANVAGLGVLGFTWNYQKGDKVGVVVEGISTDPVQSDDSSYKTMWAMSKNNYELSTSHGINDEPQSNTTTTVELNTPETGQTTTITTTTERILSGIVNEVVTFETTTTTQTVVTDDSDSSVISNETTESTSAEIINYAGEGEFEVSNDDVGDIDTPSDLNEFLYDALVSPQENTPGSNKLEIGLSYSPTNPINDPGDENGDMLIIHASIPNAKDSNYLQYKWEVYASNEVMPNEWGNPILKDRLKESTQTTGLGIDTFKFKLALEDSPGSAKFNYKYLRVLLQVTENVGEEFSRVSNQDIIIPIISISTNDQLSAHDVITSTSNSPLEVSLALGDKICDKSDIEKAVCPVIKNQIIGLSIPPDNFPINSTNFLWTIDGKAFSYSSCFFDNCQEKKQINNAYFPVTKEIGEQYTINLTATNNTGEKISLTKIFKVVDPKIEILSADDNCDPNDRNCHKNFLGKYIDVDGREFDDYSDLNFWSLNNTNVKLRAITTGFDVSPQNYTWDIDGKTITSSNASDYGFNIDNNGILSLPPKEIPGDSYGVFVSTLYSQDNLVKKALKNIWNVTYDQFYEKIVSDDAIITMINSDELSSQSPSRKIFASIYSSTPSYIAFLLRIVLTISLILFVTKLIFSFSLENKPKEY